MCSLFTLRLFGIKCSESFLCFNAQVFNSRVESSCSLLGLNATLFFLFSLRMSSLFFSIDSKTLLLFRIESSNFLLSFSAELLLLFSVRLWSFFFSIDTETLLLFGQPTTSLLVLPTSSPTPCRRCYQQAHHRSRLQNCNHSQLQAHWLTNKVAISLAHKIAVSASNKLAVGIAYTLTIGLIKRDSVCKSDKRIKNCTKCDE